MRPTGKEGPWDYVLGLRGTPGTQARAQTNAGAARRPRAPRSTTNRRAGNVAHPWPDDMGAAARIPAGRCPRTRTRMRHRVGHRRGGPPHQRVSRQARAVANPEHRTVSIIATALAAGALEQELIHGQEHLQDERGGQPCCVNSKSSIDGTQYLVEMEEVGAPHPDPGGRRTGARSRRSPGTCARTGPGSNARARSVAAPAPAPAAPAPAPSRPRSGRCLLSNRAHARHHPRYPREGR